MKQSVLSFLLVLMIEAICAIAAFLKEKLMRNVNRGQPFDSSFGFGSDVDFA